MRKDAWLPKHDWTIISGVLSGRQSPDIACEIGRTTCAVHARTKYLRDQGLIHEGQTLNALIARHVSLQKQRAARQLEARKQKKQRAARIIEARRNWSREEKREFAQDHRASGPTFIARQLGCSVPEVRELLTEALPKETRTRPCVRCRTVFTTPHKCRFMCDSCNAYAATLGWV